MNKINLLILPLLFIVLSQPSLHSQGKILNSRLEKKILYGLEQTFKFNFTKSEKTFDEIIHDYPNDPAGYHLKSIQYLWRYLDNRNEADYNKFISLSDHVISTEYDTLMNDIDNAFISYIIGASYSFRAMAFTRDEDYLNAVWAAKKSYSYLSSAIIADSTFYDAYMGLGLYNFMIAQTPPALKWVMRISGIAGDKEKGIEYLKLAAKKGKFSKTEANYYLSQILSEFYEENGQAEKLLVQLISKYPKNVLFNYSLALLYTKISRFNKAEDILHRIATSKDSSFIQLKRFSALSIGNLFFYRNNFLKAKSYYKNFIEDSSEDYYRGIAAFRLGLCLAFLNDSLSAAKYFNICDEGNADIDDDRYAKFFGEKYFENPPDSVRKQIIIAKNLIEAAKYKEAEKILLSFDKGKIAGSVVAEVNLYLSNVAYNLGNITQSLSYSLSVIQNKAAAKWIRAFGYFYAARSSFKLKYFPDASTYLEKARQFSDYFYENKLGNWINALEYRLQKSMSD